MSASSHRMPLIDAMRAFAVLSVLLTHFVSYFLMSDTVWDVFPSTFELICDHGGMVVCFIAGSKKLPHARGASSISMIWQCGARTNLAVSRVASMQPPPAYTSSASRSRCICS